MSATPSPPRATLLVPLLQQTVFTLFSVLLTDGGNVARAGLCVSIAYWAGALTICARRDPEALAGTDRFYLNYGLVLAWLVGVPLFHAVWIWRRLIWQ